MAINKNCPKCGSNYVQLSNERSKHGCLWIVLLGWVYILWLILKWIIGLCVFILWDWWMAIIHHMGGKGHIWQCRKWFSGNKRIYYCHNCGYNFKA